MRAPARAIRPSQWARAKPQPNLLNPAVPCPCPPLHAACSAYALWAILGLFGAHRFYVGRPVSGFVWMFTGGLFGIGWVIDFFLLAQFVEEVSEGDGRCAAKTAP